MSPLLTIIVIGIIAGLFARLLRPAPQPQIIYIEVERSAPAGGLGCVPVVFVAALALLVIALAG